MAKKEWLQKGADGLTFGERLEDLMHSRGMNKTQLAAETGISQSAISEYINGKESGTILRAPDCATVIAFAKHFDVSADYLLGLTRVMTPDVDTQGVISRTGLSEENVRLLEALQSYPASAYLEMANDFLRLILESKAMIHYVLMKTCIDVPAPRSTHDRLASEDVSVEELAFWESYQRKHGYVSLSGREALEFHCSKIADILEQALIDKYKAVAKWGNQDGID